MASVTLKKIEKVYPGEGKNPAFRAVKGVDLEIKDGEFMVLVGPSGCAKSTTLRMIAGLESISDGEILIGETVVNSLPPKKRDIAMVFQNYALYPHMTVFENMAFGLTLARWSKSKIREVVESAAEILGLGDLLDRRPSALSGGQRQRVAVGRAIVRDPKVFLFDEPLSNLDAKMRISMRSEIRQLHKRLGATMIYVTHDQTEAMTMGDRITVMNEGEILQVDTPLELYRNPANQFVAGFIGSPPMNFIAGEITGDGEQLQFIENDGEAMVMGSYDKELLTRRATLGVRPEHIEVCADAGAGDLHAKVELSEPMGSETVLHMMTDAGTQIVVKLQGNLATDAHEKLQEGAEIYLKLSPENLFLFGEDGERLEL